MEFGSKTKNAQKRAFFHICKLTWLGMRDSNPRMLGPEPSALPLGESPLTYKIIPCSNRIRPTFRGLATQSNEHSSFVSLPCRLPLAIFTPNAGTLDLSALPLGESPPRTKNSIKLVIFHQAPRMTWIIQPDTYPTNIMPAPNVASSTPSRRRGILRSDARQ